VVLLKATDIPVDHYEFARQPNAFTHHGNLTAALAVWQRIAKHLTTVFNYM
jgi:acetyl esterase